MLVNGAEIEKILPLSPYELERAIETEFESLRKEKSSTEEIIFQSKEIKKGENFISNVVNIYQAIKFWIIYSFHVQTRSTSSKMFCVLGPSLEYAMMATMMSFDFFIFSRSRSCCRKFTYSTALSYDKRRRWLLVCLINFPRENAALREKFIKFIKPTKQRVDCSQHNIQRRRHELDRGSNVNKEIFQQQNEERKWMNKQGNPLTIPSSFIPPHTIRYQSSLFLFARSSHFSHFSECVYARWQVNLWAFHVVFRCCWCRWIEISIQWSCALSFPGRFWG